MNRIDRFITDCSSFEEFRKRTSALPTKKQRGDVFERLVQVYLQTNPTYSKLLKTVWRLEKARESVLARTGVPRSDKGIDLLAEDYDGNDWAIQAKYRTDEDVALGWKKDLSTFHLTHSSR